MRATVLPDYVVQQVTRAAIPLTEVDAQSRQQEASRRYICVQTTCYSSCVDDSYTVSIGGRAARH